MNWLKELAISTAISFFIGLKSQSKAKDRKMYKSIAHRLFEAIRIAYADDEDFQ